MSVTITIDITGDPKPGGSKTSQVIYGRDGQPVKKNGRILLTTRDDAKGNKDWKTSVAVQARDQYRGPPLDEPLRVDVTFYKARPKGHFRAKGGLTPKAAASIGPTTRPDATKLWRSTEDAMTGIVWRDDGVIVTQTQRKRWADGRPPGAVVVVTIEGGT